MVLFAIDRAKTGATQRLPYGAAHAKYIDAFFANLNWSVLDKRWPAARR